ncbi:LysR substrate-binding domain-containing protein [Parvularcula sp. BGMRC 0090]|uniref:LysR substrate-binding domain-containing protein n=1 Tax=Parvularcula maris TaxID=2965077 RepID=A0A9X2RLK9_9PROT|nr:LysR substrate-binding domain-containing protein [Parvularcula maris]
MTAYRILVAVADEGNFASAAKSLGLSNSAVSKNVRELESLLGAQLFVRTTRSVRLTEAGQTYLERVKRLLADIEAADAAVTEMAGEPRGTLKLALPMSLGLLRVTPIVPAFQKVYPQVSVDLVLDDAKVDLIAEGFDLAVRGSGDLADSSLIARRIADLKHVLCASPAYLERQGPPESPQSLREHEGLLFTKADDPELWRLRRGDEVIDIRVKGKFSANNSMAIRQALLADAGIALIPRLYVEEDLAARRLVDVLPDWEPEHQSVWVIYPPGPHLSAKTRAFIDFLTVRLRDVR